VVAVAVVVEEEEEGLLLFFPGPYITHNAQPTFHELLTSLLPTIIYKLDANA
jgi:hypothetical protein